MRPLAFVELMELLEFNLLRFDSPDDTPADARSDPALVGVQDWMCEAPEHELPPSDVYVCSTLGALQQALLPPEDTQLRIDIQPENTVRLQAIQHTELPTAPLSSLRVDLPALIQRVLVPAGTPTSLYELVQHVVKTRLWVDVSRV